MCLSFEGHCVRTLVRPRVFSPSAACVHVSLTNSFCNVFPASYYSVCPDLLRHFRGPHIKQHRYCVTSDVGSKESIKVNKTKLYFEKGAYSCSGLEPGVRKHLHRGSGKYTSVSPRPKGAGLTLTTVSRQWKIRYISIRYMRLEDCSASTLCADRGFHICGQLLLLWSHPFQA